MHHPRSARQDLDPVSVNRRFTEQHRDSQRVEQALADFSTETTVTFESVSVALLDFEARLAALEGGELASWAHAEEHDLDAAVSETIDFFVPFLPTNIILALFGRLPKAGLVGAHGHTLTNPTVSSGGGHGHDALVVSGSNGPHLSTDNGTPAYDSAGGSSPYIEVIGGHTHGTSGGSVANAGSGGYTAALRPAAVAVLVDGVDRTTVLGGPFGTSGANWAQTTLDIKPYITTLGWHSVTVSVPTTGGRLKVQVIGYS